MSDLVEKVARAIHKADSGTDPAHDPTLCDECLDNARAAIKAVAEWLLSNADDFDAIRAAHLLERQLEETK